MVLEFKQQLLQQVVAQQIADTLEQLGPLLQTAGQQDPLVGIRQQELQNDTIEIQRKMQNDMMDFQVDQAKLQQSYDLAQQRMQAQKEIADDRSDVNIYRINTQAALSKNK